MSPSSIKTIDKSKNQTKLKNMQISYISSNGNTNIFLGGEYFAIDDSHKYYREIIEELSKDGDADPQQIRWYLDQGKVVETFSEGNIKVVNGSVLYRGQPISNYCLEKALEFAANGFPYKPLLRFMDRLMENPSRNSVQELYRFLEHKGIPITQDGYFLAHKVVRPDYMDKYSGTVDNSVGKLISMPRNMVDDNMNNHCSNGYHVGALDYIYWYGKEGDRIMTVKVDPADCVSVPTDHDFMKLRVCKYEVVAEYGVVSQDKLDEFKDAYTKDYADDDENDNGCGCCGFDFDMCDCSLCEDCDECRSCGNCDCESDTNI